jgi:hypothetical protein
MACPVKVFEDADQFTPVILVTVFDAGGEEGDCSLHIIFMYPGTEKEELDSGVMEVLGFFAGISFGGITHAK